MRYSTSNAVLAQLAVRPWSTYELAQQRVRYFRMDKAVQAGDGLRPGGLCKEMPP